MNKLLECTKGPWHGPHISDDSTTCNCTGIVDEGFAGGIARVHVDNGIASITEGGNDCPPLEQAKANGALIAAAYDHALIGWALIHADLEWGWAREGVMDWHLGEKHYPLPPYLDPFGFPILTVELRARLMAEMEAATEQLRNPSPSQARQSVA